MITGFVSVEVEVPPGFVIWRIKINESVLAKCLRVQKGHGILAS
jgi:hypothetical protein